MLVARAKTICYALLSQKEQWKPNRNEVSGSGVIHHHTGEGSATLSKLAKAGKAHRSQSGRETCKDVLSHRNNGCDPIASLRHSSHAHATAVRCDYIGTWAKRAHRFAGRKSEFPCALLFLDRRTSCHRRIREDESIAVVHWSVPNERMRARWCRRRSLRCSRAAGSRCFPLLRGILLPFTAKNENRLHNFTL